MPKKKPEIRVSPWKTLEDIPLFLTVKEVSILWGVNPRTVSNYLSEGKLKGSKPEGKSWRIPREEALKALEVEEDNVS